MGGDWQPVATPSSGLHLSANRGNAHLVSCRRCQPRFFTKLFCLLFISSSSKAAAAAGHEGITHPSELAATWINGREAAQQWIDLKMLDKDLERLWASYDGERTFHRWLNYASHYQMHLPGPTLFRSMGEKVRMLEIGVQYGGSVLVWKRFYGDTLYYVGLDIDPRCNRSRDESNDLYIEIGSQMDTGVLDVLCSKHGPFDIIIDDGGHAWNMISISLKHMLRNPLCLKQRGGQYVVEDTHVMNMCTSGYCARPSDITNIFSEVWEEMHAPYRTGSGPASIHLYRSIAFIQLGKQEEEVFFARGRDWFRERRKPQ